jgi:hypothetical protein
VRPTDENQPSSRRPNLMSSTHRAANEVNILAMLERQAGGAGVRRVFGVRLTTLACWSGGAVLACTAVASVAWLARDTDAARTVDTTLAGAAVLPATSRADPVEVGNARLVVPAAPAVQTVQAMQVSPRPGATIVNLAGAVPIEPPSAAAAAAPAVAAPLPAHVQAYRRTAHEARRPATHIVAAHIPAARNAAPKPVAAAPVRTRHPAGGAKPGATPAVDTDVALISAIMQHGGPRAAAPEEPKRHAAGEKPR